MPNEMISVHEEAIIDGLLRENARLRAGLEKILQLEGAEGMTDRKFAEQTLYIATEALGLIDEEG